jgi:hypothetical protein
MKNKLGTILVIIVVLNFTGVYLKAQRHSKASENFECKDLAALDKRCQGVGAVVSAPPQVHNEMNDFAESYWSKYICKKNGSYYVTEVVDKELNISRLYELKEVRFSGTTFEQSPADKLNNTQKGLLSANALAYRVYEKKNAWSKNSTWSEWLDDVPNISFLIKKTDGKWQVIDLNQYTLPDCSKLPQ